MKSAHKIVVALLALSMFTSTVDAANRSGKKRGREEPPSDDDQSAGSPMLLGNLNPAMAIEAPVAFAAQLAEDAATARAAAKKEKNRLKRRREERSAEQKEKNPLKELKRRRQE